MYSDRVPAALFSLSGNEICYPKEAHAQLCLMSCMTDFHMIFHPHKATYPTQ